MPPSPQNARLCQAVSRNRQHVSPLLSEHYLLATHTHFLMLTADMFLTTHTGTAPGHQRQELSSSEPSHTVAPMRRATPRHWDLNSMRVTDQVRVHVRRWGPLGVWEDPRAAEPQAHLRSLFPLCGNRWASSPGQKQLLT